MCGRVNLSMSWDRLAYILSHDFDLEEMAETGYRPGYNISPGRALPTLIMNPRSRRLREGFMRWSYVPFARGASDGKKPFTLINARGETLDKKPSFADSFHHRPCLIPVEGFYEWKTTGDVKTPYYFHGAATPLLYLAGLYTRTPEAVLKQGENPYGFLIVTTEANTLMKPVHDRMPVILSSKEASVWLDATRTIHERKALLGAAPENPLVRFPVGSAVNSTRFDGPDCIRPL